MTTLSKEDVVRAAFDKTFDPDDNGTHWHTFRDGYECGEQAARANLVAENERLKESVRTQESKVLKEQITSLELYQENERLKATPPDQRQDLHCVVSDIAAECRELRDQLTATHTALAAVETRETKLRDELEKIACLGNGNMHGNSTGNCMAIDALAQPRDDSALREMIAGVYEECAKECDSRADKERKKAKPWQEAGERNHALMYMQNADQAMLMAQDIRALAEKAKGK